MSQLKPFVAKVSGTNRKISQKQRSQTMFLITLMALPFIQWLIFWFYVNFNTILLAFKHQRTSEFTLSNFVVFWESLTSSYGEIGLAIKNTLIYFSATIFVIMPLSLTIAYFIYKRIYFYRVFRIIFYLPAIIAAVAMVTAYTNFIDPQGPLGAIAKMFGSEIPREGLLGSPKTATTTIVIYAIWTGFSGNMLLFGGAMTRIPIELLESSRLDGSTAFKEFVFIIFPLMWATISTVLIFACTSIFNASGPILLFTNGAKQTTTLSFWIFKQVYGEGQGSGTYNLVSCAGLCFTLVGVPVILFIRKMLERIPTVEY